MKKLLLIYIVLSISLFAFETTENNINNNILYNIEVIRIYDGDTFFVNIPDVSRN